MVKWRVRRILVVGGLLVLAGAAVATWQLLPRDSATPLAVAGARPGIFVYDTTGFEQVDAFGGARHDYPARTTIAVRRAEGGCSVFRWRPLAERFYEWKLCGRQLRRFTELHRFFGRDDRRTYRCDDESSLERGWSCTAQGTTETARVVSSGRSHVLLRTELTGETTGSGTRELWLRPDGVPRRLVVENESTTPSFLGDVHYRERYELRLRPGGSSRD
jgi:hypothetical protein